MTATSPWRLLAGILASVFVAEGTEMAVIKLLDARPTWLSALFDAAVLTLLLFPVLYLLSHRPLVRSLRAHRRAEAELKRSISTQTALQQATSPEIGSIESEALLEKVIDAVLPLVGANAAWVTVPGDDRSECPRVIARRGISDDLVAAEVGTPLATCPVCGPLLDGRRSPAGIQLLRDCPRISETIFAGSGISTHVGLLVSQGIDKPAILNIGWRSSHALSEIDRNLLAAMAHQLGISMHNVRLYHEEKQARHTAQVFCRASLAVARTLDLDTVIEALLGHLAELVPYDRATVMLLAGESRLRVHAIRETTAAARFPGIEAETFEAATNPVIQRLLSGTSGMIIGDTHRHPAWGPRTGPDQEYSWLGVPLVAGDTALGLISLVAWEPGFYTRKHLELAEGLAAPASIAIRQATLFAQVQSSRERMETLSRQLVELQESERRAVARELHDEAGQALTSLKIGLRLLENEVQQPEAVIARTAELRAVADAVQENLHRVAANLRPASLDHLGLVAALRQYVGDVDRQTPGIVEFEAVGFDRRRLPPQLEIALFRIVQEAVTNCLRHAGAERVSVVIEQRDDCVVVVVEDDGVGFAQAEIAGDRQFGLLGMRERTAMLGGKLVIESSPGHGTTIVAEVPNERG